MLCQPNCVHSRPIDEHSNGLVTDQIVFLNPVNSSDGISFPEGIDQQFTVQLSFPVVFNFTQTTSESSAIANDDGDEFLTSSEEELFMKHAPNDTIPTVPVQKPNAICDSMLKIDSRTVIHVPYTRKPCPPGQRRTRRGQCRVVIRMV